MFWIALLVLALAAVLVRLGALTVWVGLLSAAWKIAVGFAVLIAAAAGWRFVVKR
jgi:hypothetical protein